ncbi:hypothetical protein HYPSUDRAFT_58638 [Hypholoma sublateritium FD-334 SS-4]|uniref:Uncharacterized protein n=1 Tax=Hypholoma sublateritium (strain FD-334 SS-4) TaxID=945553 RepID=A0A0D2KMD4_HYPSF|nr:hypothetical protein HYPSUDRAFT_58638 [Hypholoma sublateritium FD-334 SS-4]
MASKKAPRKTVPVFCDLPPPKLEPWEETWKSMMDFSPIRGDRSPEPAPLDSRPLHQASVLATRNNRKVDDDENIPPPSTQPRRPVLSPSFSAAPGGSKVPQRSGKFKRLLSESTIESDDNGVQEVKRQRLSENVEENLAESVVRVAGSIDRMAAEAREDRQELHATLKKLVRELQRKM